MLAIIAEEKVIGILKRSNECRKPRKPRGHRIYPEDRVRHNRDSRSNEKSDKSLSKKNSSKKSSKRFF